MIFTSPCLPLLLLLHCDAQTNARTLPQPLTRLYISVNWFEQLFIPFTIFIICDNCRLRSLFLSIPLDASPRQVHLLLEWSRPLSHPPFTRCLSLPQALHSNKIFLPWTLIWSRVKKDIIFWGEDFSFFNFNLNFKETRKVSHVFLFSHLVSKFRPSFTSSRWRCTNQWKIRWMRRAKRPRLLFHSLASTNGGQINDQTCHPTWF